MHTYGFHYVSFYCGFLGYNFKIIGDNSYTYLIHTNKRDRLKIIASFSLMFIIKITIRWKWFLLTSGQIHPTSGSSDKPN